MVRPSETANDNHRQACPGVRQILIGFGWLNVGLGIAGVFVPLMPTTVFLLIALWAFSRSTPRLHRWLWNHKRLGPGIQAWHRHRIIPPKAKLLAVGTMAASLGYVTMVVAEGWALPLTLAIVLGAVASWILTRPSRVVPVSRVLLAPTRSV